MHAIATLTSSLSLLVPGSLLPQEGDETNDSLLTGRVSSTADLFNFYQGFAAPRAVRFVLSSTDVALFGDLNDVSTMQFVRLSPEPETRTPRIETLPGMTCFDWAGVIREVGHAMMSEHFLGTPEELARVFSEGVRDVSARACEGFRGNAVPLLSVRLSDDTAEIAFLGIWLADEAGMDEVRSTVPGATWQDGGRLGQNTSILLDAAEVEGRGLREAVLSAAMVAMVFGSASSAQAADNLPKGRTSKLASFFGGGDSHAGEKLQVKSQRLVQAAPRVYRDVLGRQQNDLRIIIDIGAQRAYMLKDGDIAFETPISSGRSGHMTARGTYSITEKVRSGKYSTIYKCPMPGWMRIGELPIGMHEGELPGYPASHGCVRMPIESALFIFDHAPRGTTVQIVDSWTPSQSGTQARMVAAN
jgi:lipoprotein-anchoring transpeptidase ErfK/SrfK